VSLVTNDALGEPGLQLYSRAVREYVARHSAVDVTSALDALYAQESPDTSFATVAGVRTLEHTRGSPDSPSARRLSSMR